MGDETSAPVLATPADTAPFLPGPLPPESWGSRLRWYLGAMALALVLAGIGYRLDVHDLRVPLLYHDPRGLETDSLLILPMVKSTIETGTHWRCDRLGAPGIQEMHDFPVIDHFHLLWIWVLGQFIPNVVVVFNVYFLLTFPLTVLTSMLVLRHFGLSLPASATAGILYAFTPYHLLRWENHYFLSAYYVVPLALMVMIWICQGRLPFFNGLDLRHRFRVFESSSLLAMLIGIMTASAGAYYAFFACALFLGAGIYGWVVQRTWRAFASACLCIGVIFVAGIANHGPTIPYHQKYGKHSAPTQRYSEEAEYYGLKITQLLLPIEDHSLEPLAVVKSTYNSVDRPVQSWTERYSLGTVGAIGFVLLCVRGLLPLPRAWPYAPLAALTLMAVMIGTVGGLGAIFNHLITPQVRCYNRIAIYIAFLSLFAIVYAVDQWVKTRKARLPEGSWKRRGLTILVWGGIVWFGIWDQTPFYWGGPKTVERQRDQCDRFWTDAEFYRQIEDALNPDRVTPGPMVFQLPYVRWPESPSVVNLFCYEHARGYIHTDTLHWSFGTMKGREVDEWQREVSVLASPAFKPAVVPMLLRLVKAGFEGLYLDKRGYTPVLAEEIHRDLNQALGGSAQWVHPDGKQIFFDLRSYRDAIRQQVGRSWEAECERERNPATILWLDGFFSFKEPGFEWQHRWCGPKGLAIFVNPGTESVTFRSRFHIRTDFRDPMELEITGGEIWTETLTIDRGSPMLERTFVIPPGRHTVKFRCRAPKTFMPNDPQRLQFFIAGLRLEPNLDAMPGVIPR